MPGPQDGRRFALQPHGGRRLRQIDIGQAQVGQVQAAEVDMQGLRGLVGICGLARLVAKIDVEGMELAALKGLQGTIASHHPILYVENDRAEQIKPLVVLLEGWGYKLYQHFPQLFNPNNFAK